MTYRNLLTVVFAAAMVLGLSGTTSASEAESCSAFDDDGAIVDVKNGASQFAIWDTDIETSQFYGGGGTSYGGSSLGVNNPHRIANFRAFVADMLTGDGDSNPYGEVALRVLGSDQILIILPGSQGSTDVILAVGSFVADALDRAAGVHVDVKNRFSQFAIWDTDTEHRQFYGGGGTSYGGSSLNRGKRGARRVKALVADLLQGDGDFNRYGQVGIRVLGSDEFELILPGSRGTTDVILVTGSLAEEALRDTAPGSAEDLESFSAVFNAENGLDDFVIVDTDVDPGLYVDVRDLFMQFVAALVTGLEIRNDYGPFGIYVLPCGQILGLQPGNLGTVDWFLVLGFLAEEAIAETGAGVGSYGF